MLKTYCFTIPPTASLEGVTNVIGLLLSAKQTDPQTIIASNPEVQFHPIPQVAAQLSEELIKLSMYINQLRVLYDIQLTDAQVVAPMIVLKFSCTELGHVNLN